MSWTDRLRLIAPVAVAGALSACASMGERTAPAGPPPRLPTEQFKLTPVQGEEQVALGVHPGPLSADQQQAIAALVAHWRVTGEGPMTLRVPPGDEGRRSADLVLQQLAADGVPLATVRQEPFSVAGGRPVVVLAFARYTVTPPDCSTQWSNLASTNANRPYGAFGCAVASNAAVQLADPRDLLGPQPETPADNSRRQVVIGKYRKGEVTGSEKDEQASGAVSRAVGK